MKIYVIILEFFYTYDIWCKEPLSLNKVLKLDDFYQVTSFASDRITEEKILDLETYSFPEYPTVKYSFYENRQTVHNIDFKGLLKSVYAIQNSLITFYTHDLNEVRQFIDFISTQISVRKRSSCLIVYIVKKFHS